MQVNTLTSYFTLVIVIVLLALSLDLSEMNGRLKCGAPCGRSFDSSRALLRHRPTCVVYQHTSSARNVNLRQKRLLSETDATHTTSKKVRSEMDIITGEPNGNSGPSSGSTPFTGDSFVVQTTNTEVASTTAGPSQSSLPDTGSLIDATTSQNTAETSGRPIRSRRLPVRFRDLLPEPSLPSQANAEARPSESGPTSRLPRVILHVFDSFRTTLNKFGVARDYHHRPSYDPDAFVTIDQLSNAVHAGDQYGGSSGVPSIPSLPPVPPWPWKNMGIWRLMTWMLSGSRQKSEAEVTRLVHEVINPDDFDCDDFKGFNARTQMKHLDRSENTADEKNSFAQQDSWRQSPVDILIPTRERNPDGNGQKFTISGLFHRSLVGVIRAAFAETTAKWFHLTPFQRIWKSPVTGQEQRIYDELYTSDAWIRAHDELQKQRRDDGCDLERVIAGLMFWSDATHLAQFGHASAWPVYLFFGNQSKYARASPNSGACHPIAFIPTLPERVVQFVSGITKKRNIRDILTHCKRELFHAVWKILLDDEFIDAYRHGIVIKCYDGKYRRVFPRVFTYSADYPEKVLLATIRDKGNCPCPWCLVPKTNFHRLGLMLDVSHRLSQIRSYMHEWVAAARAAIYKFGSPIKGVVPEVHLKAMSLVPTLNAFADTLGSLGCNIYQLLVVDLLHEFELGVFKSVFRHLLRLLHAIDPGSISTLNDRFRQTPPFGKSAIRRFPPNVADMRQCAARHFEDVLQCAIPAFEELFPSEHDNIIRTLLFRLAQWHALAKLRLHTDNSLCHLDDVTRALGRQLRKFQGFTCNTFHTMELPSEAAARWRRKSGKLGSSASTSDGTHSRPKLFNLSTYKLHALGDYVTTIRLFGTTNSYTTQIGEVAHRLVKKYYQGTNKREPAGQIAKQERRHTLVRRQRDMYLENNNLENAENDMAPDLVPLELHHRLSDAAANAFNLAEFLQSSPDDPALQNFIPKLKDHLLSRLMDLKYDGDEHSFSSEERRSIRFINNLNSVRRPKRFQVNFTTYDMRRDQDTLHPGQGSAVMLLSREDSPNSHPFWYAQVLGAFLITVDHEGNEQKMEFLWVRWFGVVPGYHWGLKNARLPKIGFVPSESGAAFGFLDPSLVLRACHLIPAFANGRTDTLLRYGPSVAREDYVVDDWMAYYVNIFADRDMFMRYTGLGAGHHAQYHPPTMETCEDGANDVGDPSDTLDDEDSSELGDGETKDVQSVSMDEGLEDGSDDAEGPEDSEDEMDSSSEESEEEEEEEEEEEDSDGDSVFEF